MFVWARGGVSNWGTLCGALIPAGAIIELVAGKDKGLPITSELLGWYTDNPFPSTKFDALSKFPGQVQTVAKSPLCHNSVSRWLDASKKRVGDPERGDRCAKVSGDVAYRTAEYLNAFSEGKFVAAWKPSEEYASCLPCHRGANSLRDDQVGYSNCLPCHGDPHKKK